MKTFLTRVDLSDDRQIKQEENKETTFSGSINTLQYSILGQNYSDLKKGVDLSTSAVTSNNVIPVSVIFNFTGTTGSTTYFGIPSLYSSIIPNLPIITNQNYDGPDFIVSYFDSIETVSVDGNVFDITFSGAEFNFNVYDFGYIGPISGGTFSGYCSTNDVVTLSARTYDWFYLKSGSTAWLRVLGRLETDRLTVESLNVPTTSGDTGITGTITWDSDYLYVCIATDTWKRCPLSSW